MRSTIARVVAGLGVVAVSFVFFSNWEKPTTQAAVSGLVSHLK